MKEHLVFKIFPVRLSNVDKFYEKTNVKSKWFSILVEVTDDTLMGAHYFPILDIYYESNWKNKKYNYLKYMQ